MKGTNRRRFKRGREMPVRRERLTNIERMIIVLVWALLPILLAIFFRTVAGMGSRSQDELDD